MLLRTAVAGGAGIIAGMFVGCMFWFAREPDRLMWAAVLSAGFVGGIVGAMIPSKSARPIQGPTGHI